MVKLGSDSFKMMTLLSKCVGYLRVLAHGNWIVVKNCSDKPVLVNCKAIVYVSESIRPDGCTDLHLATGQCILSRNSFDDISKKIMGDK